MNNEVVHHIDGNSLNNDIDNLELMEKENHVKFHSSKRRLMI
jgi:hypothetical protein